MRAFAPHGVSPQTGHTEPVGNRATRSRREIAQLALVSTLCASCGPTPEKLGNAALLVLPLIHVLAVGWMALLLKPWRRVAPQLRVQPAPQLTVLAVLTIAAAVTASKGLDDVDFMVIAGLHAGAATLTGAAVLWLLLILWTRRPTGWLFAVPPVAVSLVTAVMAAAAANSLIPAIANRFVELWIYEGWLIAAPLAITLTFFVSHYQAMHVGTRTSNE